MIQWTYWEKPWVLGVKLTKFHSVSHLNCVWAFRGRYIVHSSPSELVVSFSLWCHATLASLTQMATESSLTTAESLSDGLERDNYKFCLKCVACPIRCHINSGIGTAVHHTHKHALHLWITNQLMWDDIFQIRTYGVLLLFFHPWPSH